MPIWKKLTLFRLAVSLVSPKKTSSALISNYTGQQASSFLDSRLIISNLHQNFEARLLKVESLINKWERRRLTTTGRVAIAKAILLSQFVYFLQVLDVEESTICERIEKTLHNFIKGKTSRNWLAADLINTPKSKGWTGFFQYQEIHNGHIISLHT